MNLRSRFFAVLSAFVLLFGTLTACRASNPVNEAAIKTKNLVWAVSTPLPSPSDFVSSMPEGTQVSFAEEYSFQKTGIYTLELVFSNGSSKVTKEVVFSLVFDEEPPEIIGVKDLSVTLGEGVSYRKNVTVSDNCDGEVSLTVDDSAVDLSNEGVYEIRYTARDAAGNTAEQTAAVHVYRFAVTEEMLTAIIDQKIQEIGITADLEKEEKCRKVYAWIQQNVHFVDESDKSDWVRAAYLGLTAEPRMEGDCFTFFSIAKAFLNRMGIENLCIQRSPEASAFCDATHYWNYVNLGSEENPRWYHYDTTILKDGRKNCLVTTKQLLEYDSKRDVQAGYFYAYDPSGFPKSDTQVITTSFY